MRKSIAVLAAAFAVLLAIPAAQAHVTVQPSEAPAGAFFRWVARVPSELPEATVKLELQFADPVLSVRVQPKPGWKATVKMRELDEPMELFGAEVTEVVDSITWSGGRIEDGEFDEFGFSGRAPEEEGTLTFPALQTYESGEVVRWIGAPDSEEPAATVSVLDLGLEEGQGELGAIAQLQDEVEAMNEHMTDMMSSLGEDDDSGTDTGTILGAGGLGLGAIALIVALLARRSA